MLEVTVRRPIAPADVEVLRRLVQRAEAVDGHPVVGDSVWRDLAHPSSLTALAVASLDGDPVAALHVAAPEHDTDQGVTMALVVDPAHRADGLDRVLVETMLEDRSARDRRALLWVFGADDSSDAFAASVGLHRARELRQLRVPLPLAEVATWPAGVAARPFRIGVDEAPWLGVNNRAFAADPDQGGWSLDTLRRRQTEAWFDPAGFLLAWRDRDLAGFCWTRLHPPAPPREPETLGEIYVIGVDPDHQGIGLGRALVVGGLAVLHEHGATTGMLFVDAANTPALGLYGGLGFVTSRVDRAYVRDAP